MFIILFKNNAIIFFGVNFICSKQILLIIFKYSVIFLLLKKALIKNMFYYSFILLISFIENQFHWVSTEHRRVRERVDGGLYLYYAACDHWCKHAIRIEPSRPPPFYSYPRSPPTLFFGRRRRSKQSQTQNPPWPTSRTVITLHRSSILSISPGFFVFFICIC